MDYRLYQPGDFAQLYAVEEACFQPPIRFSRAYMRQLIQSEHSDCWIAEDGAKLVGFAIVEQEQGADIPAAYIQTVEVAQEFRGQGIGAELMLRAENSARVAGAGAIWLHVDAQNLAAIRLYERHGYKWQGREEHYYARNRAALVYEKPLE